jgi:hypothetical protein
MRMTNHRQHVMLAKADHANIPKHHELVVAPDFLVRFQSESGPWLRQALLPASAKTGRAKAYTIDRPP